MKIFELTSKRLRHAEPQLLTEDEYNHAIAEGSINLRNFNIKEIEVRKIHPPMVDVPVEVKTKQKKEKNEG